MNQNGVNKPLVSVIVPVYNVQEYISKCIRSIQRQTMPNFELILVDDGSTDLSGWICDSMQKLDERIQVVHKKNGGLSDARNVGIDIARGDFLFFVDSDDWIDEDTLEVLLNLAIRENADIVECSYRNIFLSHIEEETSNTGEMIIGDSVYAMQCQLDWRYFKSVAWNKLYSKKIFADGKRYPVGRYHEDEFFTHQAFYSADKLVYIDTSKYNYVRERAGSITGKVTSKILDGCYAVRERINFAEEKGMNCLLNNMRNAYCWILFDRLYRCHQAGVYDEQIKKMLEFLKSEEEEALSWDISIENKRLYIIICKSYDLFAECYQNPDKMKVESGI